MPKCHPYCRPKLPGVTSTSTTRSTAWWNLQASHLGRLLSCKAKLVLSARLHYRTPVSSSSGHLQNDADARSKSQIEKHDYNQVSFFFWTLCLLSGYSKTGAWHQQFTVKKKRCILFWSTGLHAFITEHKTFQFLYQIRSFQTLLIGIGILQLQLYYQKWGIGKHLMDVPLTILNNTCFQSEDHWHKNLFSILVSSCCVCKMYNCYVFLYL